MKWPDWKITYVQLEMVKDGKNAARQYGPYWYGYNFAAALQRKCYIGKELPRELAHLTNDRAHWQEPLPDQGVMEGFEPGPQELPIREAASSHWFELLGVKDRTDREHIRKRVYHFPKNDAHGHNDRVACKAWFLALCSSNGWALPR